VISSFIFFRYQEKSRTITWAVRLSIALIFMPVFAIATAGIAGIFETLHETISPQEPLVIWNFIVAYLNGVPAFVSVALVVTFTSAQVLFPVSLLQLFLNRYLSDLFLYGQKIVARKKA